MLPSLRDALTHPRSFFVREAADPGLRGPVAIVSVLAVVGLLSSIPAFRALVGAVPEGARTFVVIGLVVGGIVGLLRPFVIWLAYALMFHGLSALFDAEGEFRDLFALAGWGFAPNVVSAVVRGVVIALLVAGAGFSSPGDGLRTVQSGMAGPVGLLLQGFSLLMTLWSAWLWTHAVEAARGIPRRQAAIVVGVVVVVGVLVGYVPRLLL